MLKSSGLPVPTDVRPVRFSALQRAEIAEIIGTSVEIRSSRISFSALQRAEIAEIYAPKAAEVSNALVSVLFNEPKLLKSL